MSTYAQEMSVCTGPQVDYQGFCIPNAVAAKATKWPDAVALTCGSQVVTYQDLDSQSNRVAHYLRSLGVGPDVLVGVVLPRSPELAAAALGVLKAGGAYVPMDPAYPADRLGYMLQDSQAPVVITSADMEGRLPAAGCALVDMHGPEVNAQPDYALRVEIVPEDLAYVIYTSGSTGRPKGVEITHGGLANLVCWHQQSFSVTPGDRASHLAGLGFDAAVWELWPYLSAGASVHFADDTTRISAEFLRDWLLARKITLSFVPTPLAEQLLTLKWPTQAPLRFLLTGGDTLHVYPPEGLPFTLVNNYGPTECTVVATSCAVAPEPRRDTTPSIGRPISNTRIRLLNERFEPVSPGQPGEIYIGGVGLARGYHNQLGLTAEKFIRDPFSSEPRNRLYRTGDLGRLLPDGAIAFLGRVDDQIKIRGYRIEPNEIVCALNRYSDVCESLVVTSQDASGEKALVAYVVLSSGSRATYMDLREHLSKQLPDYMVPAVFVRLDSFPLTYNGKIDRRVLPQPTLENTLRDDMEPGPSSAIEKEVAETLAGLLRVEQVGPDENFFQMGGHSLLGAQLIARIRDIFGVELTLRCLFENPTVREMSFEIERLILAKLAAGEGKMQPTPSCPEGATA